MRFAHQAVMITLYAHATYVALRFAPDDLIEGRRRFRVIFALAVAAAGLLIAFGEIVTIYYAPSRALMLFHASSIALLTFAFALWLCAARGELLDGRTVTALAAPLAGAREMASSAPAADRPFLDALRKLMAEGAWREEGLTVAVLAGRVGLAEHNLRRLINGQLGFRNFSAFLNSYRIEEAKTALADPAQARRQILQIALDLGYGSIAPFNRAFKDATGLTPTEFRKARLGEA
jgi:AraC-like DNA-binding protein